MSYLPHLVGINFVAVVMLFFNVVEGFFQFSIPQLDENKFN